MTEPIHDLPSPDRPPLFTSWGRLYAFVLGFLALLIVAFYLLGKAFS